MRRPRALTSLRPLLVASAGVTALAVGSCTGISSGNLIAPVCDGGPEFKILHTNALADDDMGMATPAIVGERLLLRTAARIYCIAPQGRAATAPPPGALGRLPEEPGRLPVKPGG